MLVHSGCSVNVEERKEGRTEHFENDLVKNKQKTGHLCFKAWYKEVGGKEIPILTQSETSLCHFIRLWIRRGLGILTPMRVVMIKMMVKMMTTMMIILT